MANESGILLEYPILITGGDGSTVWQGNGLIGSLLRGYLSAEGTASANYIKAGDGVATDVTTILTPWTATTPVQQYGRVKRMTATLSNYMGVALNKALLGEPVLIAGMGSVVPITSLASASLTNNAAKAYVVASATAGAAQATNTAPTAPESYLGKVVKIAGTTGGATDSGSDTNLVVRVTCT